MITRNGFHLEKVKQKIPASVYNYEYMKERLYKEEKQ